MRIRKGADVLRPPIASAVDKDAKIVLKLSRSASVSVVEYTSSLTSGNVRNRLTSMLQ